MEDSQEYYQTPRGIGGQNQQYLNHNHLKEDYYELYRQQQKTLGREVIHKGRLHYLNDSGYGINTAHHKEMPNNQMVLQGLKNLYEEQGAGIASNTMTFFKIQRNLFGFSVLVAPMCIKEYGVELFAMGIGFTCIINIFASWLLSKAERRFRNEFFMITNLHDLTYLCFGDWVIVV